MTGEIEVTVRYAETDQMGIVHHSVYPIWFEAARTAFIRQVGMSYSEMEQAGVMLPLLELSCRYQRPAHYEDELVVRVEVCQLTLVRIEFSYTVCKKGESSPICIGKTLHVFVDQNFRPVNLSKYRPEIYRLIAIAAGEEEKDAASVSR